jgi:hypothetical protein
MMHGCTQMNARASPDRLQCHYKGASITNRALIGNGGVREFALAHQFKSGDALLELLPSEPRFPYQQVAAKRFQCSKRRTLVVEDMILSGANHFAIHNGSTPWVISLSLSI